MSQHDPQSHLDERLRRDAAAMREGDASPELVARIVAAIDAEETRLPSRPVSRSIWIRAAAALFLLVLGAWALFGRDTDRGAGPMPESLASADALGDAGSAAPGPSSAAAGSTPVGVQVRGWARSSSMMLRSQVDDPLRRELHALSLDFERVIDAVVIGLPEAIARPFEGLF